MTPVPPPTHPIWENATSKQQQKVCQLLTKLLSQYLKTAQPAPIKEEQDEPKQQNQ